LPCFLGALWQWRRCMSARALSGGADLSWRFLFRPGDTSPWLSRAGLGRLCLLLSATGMIGAGFTIQAIVMTQVLVETDLKFMGLDREQLHSINSRLIPLVAHDRAGFGGGIATAGILLFACVWCAKPCRSLWQGMLIGGIAGWGAGVGIHPIIGYDDAV